MLDDLGSWGFRGPGVKMASMVWWVPRGQRDCLVFLGAAASLADLDGQGYQVQLVRLGYLGSVGCLE